MSGNCVGLSSSFFRASESNVRQFFDGWFWLVGLESCWGFLVSHASSTPCSRGPSVQSNRCRSCHRSCHSIPVHYMVLHVFGMVSKLPVRWCQAVALAFLHLSLGRQKATSGSFSTDGFGWLGLNPAGVSLFRMHVERCPSGPLSCIQPRPKLLFHGRPLPGFPWFFNNFDAACQVMSFLQFRRCLSRDVRQLLWPFPTDPWYWYG